MAEDWTEDTYGEYEGEPGSDLVKTLRKQLKEKSAAERAQAEELAKLRTENRTTSVKAILSDKGMPSKVAGLIPSNIEPTPEAVGKWLEDYGDVIGMQEKKEEAVVEPEAQQQMQTMQQFQQTSDPSTPRRGVTEADIYATENIEDLRKLIAGAGS